MTMITFDKLAYVDRLTSSGIEEKAARAHADSLDIALREQVATKADLEKVESSLKADLRTQLADLRVQMILATLAIVAALNTVLFFALRH